MMETLQIDDLTLLVRRSDRRRKVDITIERDGSLVVRAPTATSVAELHAIVSSKRMSVYSALARKSEVTGQHPPKQFVSGEGFFFLGEHYRLKLVRDAEPSATEALRLVGDRFLLREDQAAHGRDHFARWYTEQARNWLRENLPPLERRVGAKPTDFAVINLGYRWGSCSKSGRLNLHWKTIMLPPPIVSYLVLHELCHLLVHNHSPAFWNEVRRVDHDYERKERWLRENGGAYEL